MQCLKKTPVSVTFDWRERCEPHPSPGGRKEPERREAKGAREDILSHTRLLVLAAKKVREVAG